MPPADDPMWVHPPGGSASKGTVLFVGGLNNSCVSLLPLAREIARDGYSVRVVHLSLRDPAPGGFREQWEQALTEAVSDARCIQPDAPLHGIGYSLGAAILLDAILKGLELRSLSLIAPAVRLRPAVWGLAVFRPLLRYRLKLPSVNLARVREYRWTPLAGYAALGDLILELPLERIQSVTSGLRALWILSPRDELIDSRSLLRDLAGSERCLCVTPKASNGRSIHHLLLDEPAVGPEVWHTLCSALTDHLANTDQSGGDGMSGAR